MATIQELEDGIRAAHKAGNKQHVLALAAERDRLMGSDAQPAEQRSDGLVGEAARQVGLSARAVAGGAAQLVEPFTEPVRYLMNKALPGNPIGNIEEATDNALTSVGVPEPQGALEEGVQDVARFGVGFASGFGGASKADDAVMGLLGLSKKIKTTPVTMESLRGMANEAYSVADKAGVVIAPKGFDDFVTDLTSMITKEGFDSGLHPRAATALNRLKEAAEAGKPIKLQELEILRRVVNAAGKSADSDEIRVAGLIRSAMDKYTNKLGSADVTSGDPRTAMAALKTARDAWHRLSKSDDIAWAIERAGVQAQGFSGSGFENALRTQFRQIAMNKKRMRGFTKQEQEAIKRVAMGGKMDNAMRALGKLAPTGGLSMVMSPGAGYLAGGPVGAVALPAIGAAARRSATKRTTSNADAVGDVIRGNAPEAKDTPKWLLPWLSGSAAGTDTQGNN